MDVSSISPESLFTLVSDEKVRKIIKDYWDQASISNKYGAYAGVVVLCGGVLEGLLAWAIMSHEEDARLRFPQKFKYKGGADKPISKWTLEPLIEVAKELNLIGDTSQHLLKALQTFRNFIHPYNVVSQSARPDERLANISLLAVEEVCRSLTGRMSKKGMIEEKQGKGKKVNINNSQLNFSWVIEGKLAGCAGPFLREELEFLYSQGIRALVRLADTGETAFERQDIIDAGMEDFHEPIPDFTAPRQEQVDRVIEFIRTNIIRGKPVAVSCGAGIGRTGTFLTCYLVAEGLSIEDSKALLSKKGRKPYETEEQRKAIEEYSRRQMDK